MRRNMKRDRRYINVLRREGDRMAEEGERPRSVFSIEL
jgi:hypothetical protein